MRSDTAARFSKLTSVLVAAVLTVSGCAGHQAFQQGRSDLAQGRFELGLQQLKQATEQDPGNVEYRKTYFTERDNTVNALLRQADLAIEAGIFDLASQSYAQALRIDTGNSQAAAGSARVESAQRHWGALDSAVALARNDDLESAIAKTQQVLSENPRHSRGTTLLKQLMRQLADKSGKELGIYPKLKDKYRKLINLSFAGATLQQVFDALKLASGLNYMIDKDVRLEQRITLSMSQKPVEDVLRLLLVTNQLEKRILDEDTLLIYPNTPAKVAEYREMVVRTFFLANADASKVANLVTTIAKSKDVVVDEKLNSLVLRDSPEGVRLVERIIATQDMADPEVMLELEVLEVSASRLQDIGISWPTSVSATVVNNAGVPGRLSLSELRGRTSNNLRLTVSDPLIAAQLRSQVGNANLLANPRVRVRNKQVAKILIGERVPVFTTTATANIGTSESINYLDVGLKLEIEPTVSIDGEVSMKLALEVSNILETITRASGTRAYRLGTRNTSTTLRVRDGETNVLAGLIQRDERRSNTGIPGLNETPILGKLFGDAQDSDNRTEIVLLVTPHIVRNIELPGVGLQEFSAGTDAAVGASPIQLGTPANLPRMQPGAQRGLGPELPPPVQQQLPRLPQNLPGLPGVPQSSNASAAPATGLAPPPALTPPPLVPASPGESLAPSRQQR